MMDGVMAVLKHNLMQGGRCHNLFCALVHFGIPQLHNQQRNHIYTIITYHRSCAQMAIYYLFSCVYTQYKAAASSQSVYFTSWFLYEYNIYVRQGQAC